MRNGIISEVTFAASGNAGADGERAGSGVLRREGSTPEVSLVVCTRNRGRELGVFLDHIANWPDEVEAELVVVDNGSSDNTPDILARFARSFGGEVVIVREERPGLGRARNRGWRVARAPIVAFTDDDCYPAADYLSRVKAAFADATVGFVGGRVLLHDPTDAHITIKTWDKDEYAEAGQFIRAGWIHGANMAFRRDVLTAINGFDDHLGAGTRFPCEDVDAMQRALSLGWRGKYDFRAAVSHHHGRKPGTEALEQLLKSYAYARGSYYMKCLLVMPQRWQCMRYWIRRMRDQEVRTTLQEVSAALLYAEERLRTGWPSAA